MSDQTMIRMNQAFKSVFLRILMRLMSCIVNLLRVVLITLMFWVF